MKLNLQWLTILIVMLCILPTAAGVENKSGGKTVLILPFEGGSPDAVESKSLSTGIPDMLTAALSVYGDTVRIVDRESIEAWADEVGLGLEGMVKKDAIAQIGKQFQAHYAIRGSFLRQKNALIVNVFVLEIETSKQLGAITKKSPDTKILTLLTEIAAEVGPLLEATTPMQNKRAAIDQEPLRNLGLMQGLGFYYNGLYGKAIGAFMEMAQKNPQDAASRYWLAKSFLAADMPKQAELEFRSLLHDFPQHERRVEIEGLLKKNKL